MAHQITDNTLSIDCSRSDQIVEHESVLWALQQLKEISEDRGLVVVNRSQTARIQIWVTGSDDHEAKQILLQAGIELPTDPESFSFVKESIGNTLRITVVGADVRGLIYALLEISDRIRYAADARIALESLISVCEKTSMSIRSVTRLFVSEIEDKPWFYDKAFWDEYLTELVTQRFNRFSLALGIGYDSGHDPNVKDNYFCFAYPFFLHVPGYSVRAANLPAGEAERNLEMLCYIGEQARLRGLHFQLGLWTHSFVFPASPNLRYPIEGITSENHALYCRDALRMLLEACPYIDGLTMRVHYESGIPEPAPDFWRIVMAGAERAGERLEIDMHAKGVDDELIQLALDSDSPILLSAKYWAEHLGLPYHQADIRSMEKPRQGRTELGFDALTAATRRFTRYGYGDFLKEERSYDTIFRVWPGSQRLLLWGDPAMAAGYGRMGTFCSSLGIEWFEPLAFKARKDSGASGGREPYGDSALQLTGSEWKKYRYTYRLWGRLMYDPEASADGWRRYLLHLYGAAANACEEALAHASRILPLITVAHLPSAANNAYWPEMYSNQNIVDVGKASWYDFDTPAPDTFGAVTPLDPQLFYRIDDYAEALLSGQHNGKYSPLDVAERLDVLALTSEQFLLDAWTHLGGAEQENADFRRLQVDVRAQIQIGRFFANKFRAGVSYALFERTQDAQWLKDALQQYQEARAAWEQVTEVTSVYKSDVTFGFTTHNRGHWSDRMVDIDQDIASMEQEFAAFIGQMDNVQQSDRVALKLENAFSSLGLAYEHMPVISYNRGEQLDINIQVRDAPQQLSIRLMYRHANQAESYQEVVMAREDDRFLATVPASYTDTVYPLVYYFVVNDGSGNAGLWPGLDETLSNQPYYVVRQY
jgi:hypothetical protein